MLAVCSGLRGVAGVGVVVGVVVGGAVVVVVVVVVVVAGGGHRELVRHRRMKAAESPYSERVQSRQQVMHRGRIWI